MTENKEIGYLRTSDLNIVEGAGKAFFCGEDRCRYLQQFLDQPDTDLPNVKRNLKRQLLFDPFTGLPNRLRLVRDIDQADSPILFIINIDGFEQINDMFGLKVGDYVIAHVATLLEQARSCRATALYKLAGDEYAILLNARGGDHGCPHLKDGEVPWDALGEYAAHLIHRVEKEKVLIKDERGEDKYEIMVNITIGISVASVVGRDNLIPRANVALKTAKKQHKPFMYYKAAVATHEEFEHNIHWSRVLKNAIESDTIVPYYQPILNNHTGQIEKYEALVRIIDPDGMPLSPFHFLTLSKALRLYPYITRSIVTKALSRFTTADSTVSINIDTEDINDAEMVGFLEDAITSAGVGKKVTFEILESEGIENYDQVNSFINRMKVHDCKIAIDDFGTGYSNFGHILKLKIDYLKIDAALIREIVTDRNARIIVRTIVNFAQEIGLKTIAEYVENQDILDYIKSIGIDYSQGYFIGKPEKELIDQPAS